MRAAFALVAAAVLAGPAAAQVAEGATDARDVVYATPGGVPLTLDFYAARPGSHAPAPVLVFMHGGAWARGERPRTANGLQVFRDAGFAIVTVTYRLSGVARAPAAVQDVRCAMSWIAGQSRARRLDARRIVLMGSSAGGHLAMTAGLLRPGNVIDLPACAAAPAAAAILNLYGPSDLRSGQPAAWRSPSIALWIGEGGEAMRAAMSPLAHLRADMPPLFSMHGDADPVVPIASTIMLKARLDALRVPNGIYVVKGGRHGKFAPEEQAKGQAAMLSFLRAQDILD